MCSARFDLEDDERVPRLSRVHGPSLRALAASFRYRFGAEPRLFSAPGRVNLIGEHTDYNDGFVLPIAIDSRTYVAAAPREDRRFRAYSAEMGEAIEFDLDGPGAPRRGVWGDYVEGTARSLDKRIMPVSGADLWIESTIPPGAGLSSSAALEVAVGYALLRLKEPTEPDRRKLALAAQAAEHEYVGTLCGIMDQFIVALAQRDHALLIDCRSLEARPVALRLGSLRIVICDTTVRHQLAASEYNQRRAECLKGVTALSRLDPSIRSLRDVSEELLSRGAELLQRETYRRCLHVVRETARTLEAASALEAGDFSAVGALMTASHASLRDDYEVSCRELDVVVETALAVPGVYGARMTGGGFGGSAIALVEESAIPLLEERVELHCRKELGITPRFVTVTEPSVGVCEHASTLPLTD